MVGRSCQETNGSYLPMAWSLEIASGTGATGQWNVQSGAHTTVCVAWPTVTACVARKVKVVEDAYPATKTAVRGVNRAIAAAATERRLCQLGHLYTSSDY